MTFLLKVFGSYICGIIKGKIIQHNDWTTWKKYVC
jgi:hypothetical protein